MTRDTFGRRLPVIVLGALMAASAALLLSLTSGFTFITDEWDLLLLRPGWSPETLLRPFHEHIIIAPAFVFKALQAVFGMESARPMQVAAIGTFLLSAGLLFVWLGRRVGQWPALVAAAIVLFLGAAFEDLLWAFQVGYFGSLAAGLGALIALDREDQRGDVVAAVLLVVSISFSSLGIPFALGAAVEWALNPRARRRRWFVPAVPLGFYALWWLGWGQDAESAASLSNLPDAPRYVFDFASAGVTSMLGLATGDGSEPEQPNLIWGRIGLLVLLGLAALRLFTLRRLPRGVVVTAAIALGFFALTALSQNELRPPTSSRYQLPAVVFILLVAGELLRGVRIPPVAVAVAGVVVAVTSFSGVELMREQAETRWKPSAVANRAWLGAVAIAGDAARPDYQLNLVSVTVPVDRFLEEVEASGSPGYAPEELAGLDPSRRAMVDQVLVDAEGMVLSGTDPAPPPGGCQRERVRPGIPVPINPSEVPYRIDNREDADLQVSLARFGDPPGVPVGAILPASHAWLELPLDGSTRPWLVTLSGRGTIRACG